MTPLELTRQPGSYRWYYLDVSSGDFTAVAIFMVGSLFSSRYSRNHRDTPPTAHSAVNFALYKAGKRLAWVLSEYGHAELRKDTLHIGPSSLERTPAGQLTARIVERTPWWPTAVHAELHLEPEGPEADTVTLVDGLEHLWHPFAIRARGEVSVASHSVNFAGDAYHDGNSGSRVLGTDLPGWTWVRTHHPTHSTVIYRPQGGATWTVRADSTSAEVTRTDLPREPETKTGWGLSIPARLGELAPAPRLLESSPFYARLEAHDGDVHALGEAGDFARFHSPLVRWMADFRTHHSGSRHDR